MKNKIIMIAALFAVMLSMTGVAAACHNHDPAPIIPDPDDCTFVPVIGQVSVDGVIGSGEWNTNDGSPDFYSDLYKKEDGEFTDHHYGKAYVKYCCTEGTLYVMVLLDEDFKIADHTNSEQWVKLNGSFKVKGTDIDNTAAPEFHYIYGMRDGSNVIIGWEASFKVAQNDTYEGFIIHATVRCIGQIWSEYIYGDEECESTTISIQCIPEFPTVALPIAAVIGLVFFFQSKKRKEE